MKLDNNLSDHRYITFETSLKKNVSSTFRDPRNTNWGKFERMVKDRLGAFGTYFGSESARELEYKSESNLYAFYDDTAF